MEEPFQVHTPAGDLNKIFETAFNVENIYSSPQKPLNIPAVVHTLVISRCRKMIWRVGVRNNSEFNVALWRYCCSL